MYYTLCNSHMYWMHLCALLISSIFYILFLINLRIEDLIISGWALLLGIIILTVSNILCKDVYNILHKKGNKINKDISV